MVLCQTCGREIIDFHPFKIGDRVYHAHTQSRGGLATGTVTAIKDDGAVVVTFDKPGWCGEYDRLWFKSYPAGLGLQG